MSWYLMSMWKGIMEVVCGYEKCISYILTSKAH